MKRVVMLSTTIPGGMAQVVNNLRQSGLFDKYGIRMISTHDRGSPLHRLKLGLTAFAQLFYLLLSRQVSLVHAHVAMRGSFWRKSLFLMLTRAFGRPMLVHLHGSQFEEFYEKECGPARRWLVRMVFRQAHAVIVLSEKWRAYIAALEPQARVLIIHNFVDIDALQAAVKAQDVSRSPGTILFLGEVGQRKGIFDLIRAMPEIVQRSPNARLLVGGSGDIEGVSKLASELNVAHAVTLLGWVAGTEKLRALAQASVYVLPSHNENFPVSILEAMAVGLPVVSTPVGGIPDMIRDGTDGFLVRPGDSEAIAERVSALLTDSNLRMTMGEQAAEQIAANFSPSHALQLIEALYLECGSQRAHEMPRMPECR